MAAPVPGQQLPPPTENRGPMILQSTWIMVGIATPVMIARVCARLKQMKKLGWDDWFMILALLCAIIMAGLSTESVRWGTGRHIYYLTPEQIRQAIRYSYIIGPFGILTLTFGRISFALSLVVLIGVEPWRRWLLYFVIASQAVIHAILIGLAVFACNPIHKYWDRDTPGTCLNRSILRNLGFLQAALNIFADLVLAFMPGFVVSRLNLNRKTKIGLVFLMSLGVFNLAAATVTFVEYAKVTSVVDFTYVYVVNNIWLLIQAYIVIVVASIPFLRPLFKGKKIFSLAYYRSLMARYSQKSRSTSGQDRRDSGETTDSLYGAKGGAKAIESLPHIPKDRFITTTLRNAGMETGFDRLSYVETGQAPKK